MKFHIYKAKDGWRWHLRARNGRIIAESGEAYRAKSQCYKMIYRLTQITDSIPVVFDH